MKNLTGTFFCMVFFIVLRSLGQEKCPPLIILGAGAELASSGDGHGAFCSPYISLNSGRNSLLIGGLINKRCGSFSGAKISYSRNLTSYLADTGHCKNKRLIMDRLQLNFLFYLQYAENVPLSYGAVLTEEMVNKASEINFNEIRLNTAEAGTGIEARYNFSTRLSWRAYAGVTLFYHVRYFQELYHDRIAVPLFFGTGIDYVFKRG